MKLTNGDKPTPIAQPFQNQPTKKQGLCDDSVGTVKSFFKGFFKDTPSPASLSDKTVKNANGKRPHQEEESDDEFFDALESQPETPLSKKSKIASINKEPIENITPTALVKKELEKCFDKNLSDAISNLFSEITAFSIDDKGDFKLTISKATDKILNSQNPNTDGAILSSPEVMEGSLKKSELSFKQGSEIKVTKKIGVGFLSTNLSILINKLSLENDRMVIAHNYPSLPDSISVRGFIKALSPKA